MSKGDGKTSGAKGSSSGEAKAAEAMLRADIADLKEDIKQTKERIAGYRKTLEETADQNERKELRADIRSDTNLLKSNTDLLKSYNERLRELEARLDRLQQQPPPGNSRGSGGERKTAKQAYSFPDVVKSPSKASAKDHNGVLHDLSLVHIPWVADALAAYYAEDCNEDKNAAAEIYYACTQQVPKYDGLPDQAPAGYNKHDGETDLASRFFTAFLMWWMKDDECSKVHQHVRWCHEHRLYVKSPVDVVAFYETKQPRDSVPVILMEFVLESTTNFAKKREQLRAQVRNSYHVRRFSTFGHSPSVLGVILDVSSFAFEAYHFSGVATPGDASGVGEVGLVRGGDQKDLPSLLALLRYWCRTEKPSRSCISIASGGPVREINVAIHGNTVRKFYDYRRLEPPDVKDRRIPYPKFMPDDARLVVDTDLFKVLEYPFVEGSHVAVNSTQFQCIWTKLRKLHKNGYVHADVRESNIIFGKGKIATLIDFDLCRKDGGLYVMGFCENISDGKRHKEARAGQPVRSYHDMYSLAEIMRMYRAPVDKQAEWKKLIDCVLADDDPSWNIEITLSRIKNPVGRQRRGTGSPIRHMLCDEKEEEAPATTAIDTSQSSPASDGNNQPRSKASTGENTQENNTDRDNSDTNNNGPGPP